MTQSGHRAPRRFRTRQRSNSVVETASCYRAVNGKYREGSLTGDNEMELPGTTYLYNLSVLAMTFIGFSVIVLTLRQALGHKLSNFDVLLAHLYMEFGLVIAASSLLPVILTVWELPAFMTWRISSVIAVLPLFVHVLTYPRRRRLAAVETIPSYVWINLSVISLICLSLILNAAGLFGLHAGAVFLTAMTAFLIYAIIAFLHGLNVLLHRPDNKATRQPRSRN